MITPFKALGKIGSDHYKIPIERGRRGRNEGGGLGHYTANCDMIGQFSLVPSPSNK